MRSAKMYLSLGMMLLLAPGAIAHERVWPGKRLASVWPEAARFTLKQVNLSASQFAHLEGDGITVGTEDKTPVFYFADRAGKGKGPRTLGVVLFVDEYGDNGKMEISVGLTAQGAVEKLDIWEHSEAKSIASADFLNQFIGKTHADSLEAGKDYKPAAGAPKASAAVARAVKKALSITDAVFGQKAAGKTEKKGDNPGETNPVTKDKGAASERKAGK